METIKIPMYFINKIELYKSNIELINFVNNMISEKMDLENKLSFVENTQQAIDFLNNKNFNVELFFIPFSRETILDSLENK
ncbi:MAG: hypothetical protein A2086_01570 [Spirochaetes bacterium GWD1_27_9]|nr:MAG: hypothetical protein A2Z98_08925 [Spirochaetes bacterium GWB1_27_13]OHD28060.1 MAG: hypothetical protein A2Y34_02640 [Spirochaetes bacterium GWC1_27_15]OHD41764.1 MAG: hypothetical protein A2086_01570 [Spirochaetes bacterium GWD1_27_9]